MACFKQHEHCVCFFGVILYANTQERLMNMKKLGLVAKWHEEESERIRRREEALASITSIANDFPDMIIQCAKVLVADEEHDSSSDEENEIDYEQEFGGSRNNRPSRRQVERERKRRIILDVMNAQDRPLTYKELEQLTSMTRSALRFVIEEVFPDDFQQVSNPTDSRIALLAPRDPSKSADSDNDSEFEEALNQV